MFHGFATGYLWRVDVLMIKSKYIRNFFITLIVIAVVWFLFDVTTPDTCKNKSVEQLSQFCIDLLYP
jgi:hypothetical protein